MQHILTDEELEELNKRIAQSATSEEWIMFAEAFQTWANDVMNFVSRKNTQARPIIKAYIEAHPAPLPPHQR